MNLLSIQQHQIGDRAKRVLASFLSAAVLFSYAIIEAPSAHSVAIGSGSCASNSSTSSVVVALSGGNCFVAVYATGANTWTPPAGVSTVDFLLIAGGGAGGSGAWGGGGGAGELVSRTSYAVTSGIAVSFSIGSGGTPGTASLDPAVNRSNNGGNSWVGSASGVVANGGGAGASYAYNSGVAAYGTGSNGGSGGGGTEDVSVRNGGSSTASSGANRNGYGNAGGKGGPSASTQSGGGGGGAGGAGGDAGTARGGNGGIGLILFSSWLSAISSGMSVVSGWQSATTSGYITGGGGGGTTTTAGTGGAGGGGAGGSNSTSFNGYSAVANTGSGGGGCGYGGSSKTGGTGGSGLLIIRYSSDSTAPSFSNSTTFSFSENSTTSSNAATITVNESSTVSINSGNDSALFTVVASDSVTARIRFLSSPNFESPGDVGSNNGYELSIRATDAAGNFANQSITISVTNVNEAPTISTNGSGETHAVTQAENLTSVITYAATDVDAGSSLSFSISGTDAADFAINSSSGVLAFASSPDFEAPADSDTNNTYVVVITVSDGALSDTQTLTVTITNANESATVSAPTVSGTINKGISTTITVTLNASGKVRFFLGGKRISNCLARSTTGSYPNFSATCSWKPPVTGRQSLTASITPTDISFSAATSASTAVWVNKRASSR